MKRKINKDLLTWKKDLNRKVLLIRGARQVGKTYSVRELGKTFDHFVEVNFEELKDVRQFFENSLDPVEIVKKLSIYFNTPIQPGKTLLFFDEIQACPDALRSLRFFYEKMSALHVIAAGSLLEFTLSEIPSFGVGRIENLFMYPMTFAEFLTASDKDNLNEVIETAIINKPLDPIFHKKIIEQLKLFQIIGGMPEVVRTYVETNDFTKCQKNIDTLLASFNDDFAKYKTRISAAKLQETFGSIVTQTGNKFKYSNISSEQAHGYKIALELLIKAGLAHKVYHTHARGVPLGAQMDDKKFKVLMMDMGIYQRTLGLDLADYISSDNGSLINKGNLSELCAGLELISGMPAHMRPELYYWHREKRSSNSEVDYVISVNGKIFPIEVKAGTKGEMQSMFIFLEEKELTEGVRSSLENFGRYDRVITIPIYALSRIWSLLG